MQRVPVRIPSSFRTRRIPLMLAAAGVVFALCACSSPYLGRYVSFGPPDTDDYIRFPKRFAANQPPVFSFGRSPEQERAFALLARSVAYRSGGTLQYAPLEELLERNATTAFIVIRNDVILCERYFNGHDREAVVTSFSVTKSILSALVGAAIADGAIRDIEEPVTAYLPELRGNGFDTVTIRHLLSMSSGIKYDDGIFPWSDKPKSYYADNLRELALGAELDDEPGMFFHYNNYDPLLLGLILERAVRRFAALYLEEKIWRPLGMEYPASWSIDSAESGFENMGIGINARAVDLAKFGRLYLRQGEWEGRRIIPEAWVRTSTERDPATRENKDYYRRYDTLRGLFFRDGSEYYKYLWWGYARERGYDFFAMGALGQFIYLCPEKDIIIVRCGRKWGDVDWWPEIFKALVERM